MLIDKFAVPVLVKRTVKSELAFNTTLPYFKLSLENETSGVIPVPVNATVSGVLAALLFKTKYAILFPTLVGVKRNVMSRNAFGASVPVSPPVTMLN